MARVGEAGVADAGALPAVARARERLREAFAQREDIVVLEDVPLGERTADFVVLIPERGAAVVHVHEGPSHYAYGRFTCDLRHRGKRRATMERATDATCNPATYALELSYELRRRVRDAWASRPWLHLVPAVCIVDADHERPLGPWEWPIALIADPDDPLGPLERRLTERGCDGELNGTRLPGPAESDPRGPGPDWATQVADVLTGVRPPDAPVAREWTELQLKALRSDNPRQLLMGYSGTGKTAVAQELARTWCDQGLRVAVITQSLGAAAAWRTETARWDTAPVFVGSLRRYMKLLGRTEERLGPRELGEAIAELDGASMDVDAMILEEAEAMPPNAHELAGPGVHKLIVTWNHQYRRMTMEHRVLLGDVTTTSLGPKNFRSVGTIAAFAGGSRTPVGTKETIGALRAEEVDGPPWMVEGIAWDVAWLLIADRGWLPEDIAVLVTLPRGGAVESERYVILPEEEGEAFWDRRLRKKQGEAIGASLESFTGLSRPVIILAVTGIPDHFTRRGARFISRGVFAAGELIYVVKTSKTKIEYPPLRAALSAGRSGAEVQLYLEDSDGASGPADRGDAGLDALGLNDLSLDDQGLSDDAPGEGMRDEGAAGGSGLDDSDFPES